MGALGGCHQVRRDDVRGGVGLDGDDMCTGVCNNDVKREASQPGAGKQHARRAKGPERRD